MNWIQNNKKTSYNIKKINLLKNFNHNYVFLVNGNLHVQVILIMKIKVKIKINSYEKKFWEN